jgi:hypothetical protein
MQRPGMKEFASVVEGHDHHSHTAQCVYGPDPALLSGLRTSRHTDGASHTKAEN